MAGFKLRVTQGFNPGRWLYALSVWQGRTPVNPIMDWAALEARAGQYRFQPSFIDEEKSAWLAPERESAERFQRLLKKYCETETEIVVSTQSGR